MLIFVEGTNAVGQNKFYSNALRSSGDFSRKNRNLYFYDILRECDTPEMTIHDMYSKIGMLLDLCDKYKDMCAVINNGPIGLVSKALNIGDTRMAHTMSSVFGRREYHDVAIISVFSMADSEEDKLAYRDISSRHIGVLLDHTKRNSYIMFLNDDSADVQKKFNSYISELINN